MLFLRVKLTRGVSVTYQGGGAYTAVRYPTQDEITASLANGQFYMGGTENVVDDATKAALIAAGIGVTAANFTAV
jgi:ferredoxin-NADP reductase